MSQSIFSSSIPDHGPVQECQGAERTVCSKEALPQSQHRSQVHPGDTSAGQHLYSTSTKDPRTGSELKRDFWDISEVKVPNEVSQVKEGLHTGCTQENNSKMFGNSSRITQSLEFYCVIEKRLNEIGL